MKKKENVDTKKPLFKKAYEGVKIDDKRKSEKVDEVSEPEPAVDRVFHKSVHVIDSEDALMDDREDDSDSSKVESKSTGKNREFEEIASDIRQKKKELKALLEELADEVV